MTSKAKRILFFISGICILASIIMMVQPTSTSLTFAPGPDKVQIVTYSYFDFMFLLSYANFFPPLTAISTIIWLLLFIWKAFKDRGLKSNKCPLIPLAVVCAVFSVLSLCSTINITILGITICITIITATILQYIVLRKERTD